MAASEGINYLNFSDKVFLQGVLKDLGKKKNTQKTQKINHPKPQKIKNKQKAQQLNPVFYNLYIWISVVPSGSHWCYTSFRVMKFYAMVILSTFKSSWLKNKQSGSLQWYFLTVITNWNTRSSFKCKKIIL